MQVIKQTRLTCLVNSLICFAVMVILMGVYTRLKDAGLGCPDWPYCYGKAIVSGISNQTDAAKAWIEMIHRYMAAILGIGIFLISYLAYRLRHTLPQLVKITGLLGLFVIMQALLGKLTVTMKLYPMVVMLHLLGGMSILGLLWLIKLHLQPRASLYATSTIAKISLVAVSLQILLGGWVSANYAALVCADFPLCQGQWLPSTDFKLAFDFVNTGIFNSPGTPLENTARVTIQMMHRCGAVVVTLLCLWLSVRMFRQVALLSLALVALLILQVTLGITNVLAELPLAIAMLHNFTALMLLLLLITINYYSVGRHAR